MSHRQISLYTATSIVVANMIGTGVFTSLGFQAAGISSGFAIIVLWVLGGVAALAGALCYGELGSLFPRSGGEYHYLSRIYHPSVGFMSGWVSATVGFAAPVAAASIALGEYFANVYPGTDIKLTAAGVVLAITLIHVTSIKLGSNFQNIFTTVKVAVIVAIICFGIWAGRTGDIGLRPTAGSWDDIASAGFAVSFFFVSLAYSGWNAAGYIASEIKDVQKNLPRALLRGTVLVTVLYVLINFVFMYVTPKAQMMTAEGPVVDIAGVAAQNIFGGTGGQVMSMIIAILLLSTISAMTMAGPRVAQMMGEDYSLFRVLGRKTQNGIPAVAVIVQSVLALAFIFTSTFKEVIIYVSFTLNLFTFLAVLGLFIMRYREPHAERAFKTWGYPVVPALFLLISVWLMYFGFTSSTKESLYGLATALSGLVVYFIIHRTNNESAA